MVAARTTDELVAEVDDLALLPSADGRLTTAEKLRMADRVMRGAVSDLLLGSRSGRLVTAAADVSIVSGTYLYAVPSRALAEGVSDVLIADGDTEWSAPELSVSEAHRYRAAAGPWHSPYAYTWRDDKIEILPHPTSTEYSLRVLYPRRPAKLVAVEECGLASSVGASTVTLSATPSAWGASLALDYIDSVTGRTRADDVTSGVSGTTITPSAMPSGVVAGDYLCASGETCVPVVTGPLWDVLVDGTALEVLRALSDPSVADARERYAESVERARGILQPRSRGAAKRIVARHSPLRRGRR